MSKFRANVGRRGSPEATEFLARTVLHIEQHRAADLGAALRAAARPSQGDLS